MYLPRSRRSRVAVDHLAQVLPRVCHRAGRDHPGAPTLHVRQPPLPRYHAATTCDRLDDARVPACLPPPAGPHGSAFSLVWRPSSYSCKRHSRAGCHVRRRPPATRAAPTPALLVGSARAFNRIVDIDGFANWGNPGARRWTTTTSSSPAARWSAGRLAIGAVPLRLEFDATFGDMWADDQPARPARAG